MLVVLAALAATQSWTFCIAEAGEDIFVTEVFAASLDREKLEALYAARLRASGVAHAVVQCPAPQDEKVDAVNAQFTAIQFQRKLAHKLHSLSLRR